MNGVYRGGQVESWGYVYYLRSGNRRGIRGWMFKDNSVGFLWGVNGVNRGGCIRVEEPVWRVRNASRMNWYGLTHTWNLKGFL